MALKLSHLQCWFFVLSLLLPCHGFSQSETGEAGKAPLSEGRRKARAALEQTPFGIDINATGEGTSSASFGASKEISAISKRLAEIDGRAAATRARILQLQNDLSSRFQDLANWELLLKVQSPASADLEKKTLPLVVQEISVDLNGLPIMIQHIPLKLDKNQTISIYSGPIPAGMYEVRVRTSVGLVPWDWPAVVASGKWQVEKVFQISVNPTSSEKKVKSEIVLNSIENNKPPSLSFNEGKAN